MFLLDDQCLGHFGGEVAGGDGSLSPPGDGNASLAGESFHEIVIAPAGIGAARLADTVADFTVLEDAMAFQVGVQIVFRAQAS